LSPKKSVAAGVRVFLFAARGVDCDFAVGIDGPGQQINANRNCRAG